jgi:microcystin-dependent protein
MSYKISEVEVSIPVGSIVSYFGKTDPDGWIICDGQLRTSSDSRYSNLATLLGGSNNANSLTPPNLRNYYLCGSNSIYSTNYTDGATTMSLSATNLPPHSHGVTVTDGGSHSHNHNYAWSGNDNSLWHSNISDRVASGNDNPVADGTGISSVGDHNHTLTTGNGGGASTAINLTPSYYMLYYIMKY